MDPYTRSLRGVHYREYDPYDTAWLHRPTAESDLAELKMLLSIHGYPETLANNAKSLILYQARSNRYIETILFNFSNQRLREYMSHKASLPPPLLTADGLFYTSDYNHVLHNTIDDSSAYRRCASQQEFCGLVNGRKDPPANKFELSGDLRALCERWPDYSGGVKRR